MNLIKYLLVITLMTCTQNAYSQKGIYLKPYIGAGIASINNVISDGVVPMSPIVASTAGVDIGYRFGNFQLSLGLALLNSGHQLADAFVINNANGQTSDSLSFQFIYHHILVPVTAGYNLRMSKRFSILPEIAIAPAYCTNQTIRTKSYFRNQTNRSKTDNFDNKYRHLSLMGITRVNIVCSLNSHTGLYLGLSYTQMLTNLQKGYDYLLMMDIQRQYALTANVGVMLKL